MEEKSDGEGVKMASYHPKKWILAIFILIILFSCCLFPSEPKSQDKVRMICHLMGRGKTMTKTGEVWEGDLGVMFIHDERIYLLAGDTIGSEVFAPNAIAYTEDHDPKEGLDFTWMTKNDGSPKEFFPIIQPDSTVPAGAISVNGVIYVFMMEVTHWGDKTDIVTHARSILIKSEDDGKTFSSVWEGRVDSKFVNISPIVSTHPLNQKEKAIFLVASGQYRNSPIYLAFTAIDKIEERESYLYFSGLEEDMPQWSNNIVDAVPILRGVKVGELSVQWNSYLNQWLLAYFDYHYGNNMYFRKAPHPWGPWSEPELVFSGSEKYDWYKTEQTRKGPVNWGGPYGGYLLPESEDSIVYFTLSLWIPYSIFLMEANLQEIFGEESD